tara:strand:- start:1130 stop:1645 length:516 start_codon:yes stop_codon:yes gene_type:complete
MNTFTNILMIILILLLSALIAMIVVGSLKISSMMNDMFNKELPDCEYKMPQDEIENIAEYFEGVVPVDDGLYNIEDSELKLEVDLTGFDSDSAPKGRLSLTNSNGTVLPNAGLLIGIYELTAGDTQLQFNFEELINQKKLRRDSNAFAEGEHNKVPMLGPMDAFTATCKIN